jgi:imidazoleglycerol-phosphate dehydratase
LWLVLFCPTLCLPSVPHSACVSRAGTTLHIRQLAGKNSHHIVEATFKAFARALRRATEVDERRAGQIASSKGVLTQQ